jgi:NAD(P)-dependent dehydrogenase (short-subunit alcohol dehydrogenase family)
MTTASSNRIVLITGANKGIGREIARQLAARGCHVVVTARDARRGRDATDAIAAETGGKVSFIVMDVTDLSSIRAAANEFARLSDRLDVLVNNAAIMDDGARTILEIPSEMFDCTFNTNVRGPLYVTQHFWPFLKQAGGRVINISSVAGSLQQGGDNIPIYGVSKTALNSLTHKFAKTGARDGVVTNSMCPGWVRTDMGGPNGERTVAQGAETAVWLALDAPPTLTGKFLKDKQDMPW